MGRSRCVTASVRGRSREDGGESDGEREAGAARAGYGGESNREREAAGSPVWKLIPERHREWERPVAREDGGESDGEREAGPGGVGRNWMSDLSVLTMCILLGMVGMFSCSRQKDATNGDRDMSAGIQRVETGLVPFGKDDQPQWNERAELIDRMRHYGLPGVSFAIIEGYEIALAEGHGTLRSGGDTHVTPMTLFHAGSTAKPVSAAASLRLVQQSRLVLDEDVNDKLRSWHIPDSEFTRHENVTLRRLLSHSGGLEDGFTNRSSDDPVPTYCTPGGVVPSVTIQQLLDADPGIDVDGPTRVTAFPGSQYRYANADYAIVELLIRDVTGKSFPTFMRETILEPLGMTSSTYEQPLPSDLRARAAIEHDHSGEAFPGDRLHIPLLAAGGLWTTPSDMARFVIEMMDSYRGTSRRILSRAMASEMFSKQIDIPQNPLADAAGLGFQLSGKGRDLCIVHTGGTWGSTAIVWVYPETGQGGDYHDQFGHREPP